MYEEITLENLFGGSVNESFNYELEKVKANLADINTSPANIRKIKIEIKFLPNEERDKLLTEVVIESKLTPVKALIKTLSFAQEKGKLGIFQETSETKPLFPEIEKNDNQIDLKGALNNG